MKPLLILGLDGLDPEFVEENIDDLDNFARIKETDRGRLESILPPITIPAWPCSFTGLKPEQLGRFDFQVLDFDSYEFRPTPYDNFSFKEFWNFTSSNVAVIDVPGAPLRDINGWIINLLFNVSSETARPGGLYHELEEDIGDVEIEGLEEYGSEQEKREMAFEFFERRRNILEWFLDEKEADVYFEVFRLPDTMMHHCSNDDQMLEAYRKCDELLGELLGRNLNIMVVSDHGAVKAERRFSINTWLRENGYLRTESDDGAADPFNRVSRKFKSLALKIAAVGERFGFRDYLVRANELYRDMAGEGFVDNNLDLESINWDETMAFSYMTGVCAYSGIWINDHRFPNPAVSDRQEVREEVKDRLEEHSLVEEVLYKEEAFDIDSKAFPDLVAVLGDRVKNDSDIKPSATGRVSSYMHRKTGFIGVYGEDLDLNQEHADLFDLAPTVLHYMGESIPQDMDGRVIDVFSKNSRPGNRQPSFTGKDVSDLDF